MHPQFSIFLQWLVAFAGIFANAAAALPLVISLGLVAGRRGNANFCLLASARLLNMALAISVAGILFFAGTYVFQLFALNAQNILTLILQPASLPWVSSLCVWIVGMTLLFSARAALALCASRGIVKADRYRLADLKIPLILCLGAALCFFATFLLVNWPFAGLPEGLSPDRAVMAIARNAARHYFMAFCPAGAIALVFAFNTEKNFASPAQFGNSIRWLAAWAAAGCLPHVMQSWGLLIGVWTGGNSLSAFGGYTLSLWTHVGALCCLTVAMFCWLWLLLGKYRRPAIAWAALGLLVARESLPFVIRLLQ